MRMKRSASCVAPVNTDLLGLKHDVSTILLEISNISKKLKENDEEGDRSLEWKFAAMVLDKLCLYVFGILTIVSTCGILMSSPNFFKLY